MMEDVDPPKTPDPLRPDDAGQARPTSEETADRWHKAATSQPPTSSPGTEYSVPSTPPEAPHDGPAETASASAATLNPEPGTLNPAEGPLHNLHNENPPQIAATTAQPCTCILQARIEKNLPGVCITDGDQPSVPDDVGTRTTNGHVSAAATS